MATDDRKPAGSGRSPSSGRTTPKGAVQKATPVRRVPKGLDPDNPAAVGRRPSSPGFLLVVATMWLAVGVIIFVTLNAGWRLIPAIFSIGIGLFFLRGAGATVLRREHRRSSGK